MFWATGLEEYEPSVARAVTIFGAVGTFTVIGANKLMEMPALYRPMSIVKGTVVGMMAGYLIRMAALESKNIMMRDKAKKEEFDRINAPRIAEIKAKYYTKYPNEAPN